MPWLKKPKNLLRKLKGSSDQTQRATSASPSPTPPSSQIRPSNPSQSQAPLAPSQPAQLIPATAPASRSHKETGIEAPTGGEDVRAQPSATAPNRTESQSIHAPTLSPAFLTSPSHYGTTSSLYLPSGPSSTNAALVVDDSLANTASSTYDGAMVSRQSHRKAYSQCHSLLQLSHPQQPFSTSPSHHSPQRTVDRSPDFLPDPDPSPSDHSSSSRPAMAGPRPANVAPGTYDNRPSATLSQIGTTLRKSLTMLPFCSHYFGRCWTRY
jgi:hypothetical protein